MNSLTEKKGAQVENGDQLVAIHTRFVRYFHFQIAKKLQTFSIPVLRVLT